MKKILIVDDEKNIRNSLAQFLKLEGFESETAANGLSALRLLESMEFSAMVVDLKMPGMNGLELLNRCQVEGISFPIIMMSAFGEVNDAVTAMKMGAVDYLVKPFDPNQLVQRLKDLVSFSDETETVSTKESISLAMQKVYRIVDKAAPGPSTILITGESGTGKEVLARRIHQLSPRAEKAFVAVNIGGVPENLLESELFGYEKGAFTGADKKKEGLFETASGGTILLDEIGDMPLTLQVKILRILQERSFRRLGGTAVLPIDVRILAATHKNLEKLVETGAFREDLYYRLNVIRIEIPPLRERKEDLPSLVNTLLSDISRRFGQAVPGVNNQAIHQLMTHSFPGNIRELYNILERAVVLSDKKILEEDDFEDLGKGLSSQQKTKSVSEPQETPPTSLKEVEKEAIKKALLRWDGKRGKAAEELGISRRTLLNKINEYALEIPSKKDEG